PICPRPQPPHRAPAAPPPRLLEVERHVLRDAAAPRVVNPRNSVVFAHGITLSLPRGRDAQRLPVSPAPAHRRGRTLARPILPTSRGDTASDERGPTGRINHRGLAAIRE